MTAEKNRSGLLVALSIASLLAAGCGGPEPISSSRRELPFVVRLNEVRVLARVGSEEQAIAPGFEDTSELTRRVARALRDAGAFSWVALAEDKNIDPDLELQVDFIEPDFGEGHARFTGALLSTVTWLLAGHLSWIIDNREYPDSRAVMRVDLRPAVKESDAPPSKEDWFHDDLPLKGLSLNFYERADMKYWAVNILVPPWWDDGDPQTAGDSLIDRALDYFVENEPDRIYLALPGAYFRNRFSFLVNDEELGEVLIISRHEIEELKLRSDSGRRRSIGGDELERFKVPEEGMEEARRHLLGRVVGLGDLENDFVYRLPLDEEEHGYVRVVARLRALSIPPGQWTIYRPRPGGPTP